MLEIQEEKKNKRSEPQSQEINAGWQKYNKRLNIPLDDTQIKNVWKTEKSVRTKNSKLTIISAIAISLIVLIAIQNKQYFNSPRYSNSKQAPTTSKNEFPLKPSAEKTESTDYQPITDKNKKTLADQAIQSREDKFTPSINKQSILEKNSMPAQSKEFFVQIGAFFIKDNATKLVKKLNSKGLKAKIHIRSIKSTEHQVSSENQTQKDHAASSSTKIKDHRFYPTIKKKWPQSKSKVSHKKAKGVCRPQSRYCYRKQSTANQKKPNQSWFYKELHPISLKSIVLIALHPKIIYL